MALTAEEQAEKDQLESQYGNGSSSVLVTPAQPRSFAQEFGTAVKESLPDIGGLVGGAIGVATTKTPLGATAGRTAGTLAIRSMLGSGAGALTGTVAKQKIDEIMGKPMGLEPQFAEQLTNAVTNMAFDAAGNVVFDLGGKAFKIAKNNIPDLGLFGASLPKDAQMKLQVQRLLEREGGSLTKYQVEPTSTRAITESVGRAGISGRGIFDKLDEANLQALTAKRNEVLDDISSRTLTDLESGALYKDVIGNAQDQLSLAAREAYAQINERGKNVLVNSSALSSKAQQQLDNAAKISKTGDPSTSLGNEVTSQLKAISDLKDEITFADAHEFRSNLNKQLREAKSEFGANSPKVATLTQAVISIEKAMDDAATKLNPALKKAYDENSVFYRSSITELFPTTLAKLNNKTAERVGETIFQSGNVSEIKDFYTSLDRAKKLNPDLDVNLVKTSVQKGYLSSILGEEGTDVSVTSLINLQKKLQTDKKFNRTFNEAVSPEVRSNVEVLANAAKLSQTKPQNTFSLAINSAQANQISGAVQAILAAGGAGYAYSELGTAGAVLAGGGLLMAPRVLAKMATNRDSIRDILKAESAYGKIANLPQASQKPLMLKTIGLLNQAYDRVGITPEDFTAPKPANVGVGLSPEEKQELDELESRYK
jgi:hypothetical protein